MIYKFTNLCHKWNSTPHIIYSQTIALHKNKLIFITFIGNQFVMQCTLFYIPACIYNNKFTCKKVNTCTRLPVYNIIY